jgi:hypothetical protein
MTTVRIQCLVDAGKAILRFRNGFNDEVTVNPFLARPADAEDVWTPLLRAPIRLRPGETSSADVTDSIFKLFGSREREAERRYRFRIHMLLAPEHFAQPRVVDCTVALHQNQFTEFICH